MEFFRSTPFLLIKWFAYVLYLILRRVLHLRRLLLNLIPIRFGRARQVDFNRLGNRIYSNRRNPESGFVFLGDAIENIKDEIYTLVHRTPSDSYLRRDCYGNTTEEISPVRRHREHN